ncbi:MAG: hypothetical protein JWO37_106 [Acidimicrobiales bacterium]|nr:hypothetical protein [Acidimicrobiales bacterium]
MVGRKAPLRAAAMVVTGGLAWLLAPGAATAATVPPVTVPVVSLPPITVPLVTVPPVTVPPVTVPLVTVPPVTVPPVTVPPVTIPPVTVPTVPARATIAPVATNVPVNGDRGPVVVATEPHSRPAAVPARPAAPAVRSRPATVTPPKARTRPLVRVAASSARDLSIPVALAIVVGAFLVVSPRSARAEAKLAAAPVTADDELLGFS